MAKKTMTLEHIDYSISRWKTRLKRAMTAIDKLEKQKKRLIKATAVRVSVPAHPTVDSETTLGAVPPRAKPARGSSDEPAPEKPKPVNAPVPPTPVAQVERAKVDDDIPAFLRRQTAPSPVADEIRQQQAETKKAKARGRIATMKAKQSGETRRMPLTGKAALAAIRGQ